MLYLKKRENTNIFDTLPVNDGTVNFYKYQGRGIFWKESVTNLGWQNNNKYSNIYKLWTEPEKNVLYARGYASIDGTDLQAGSGNIIVWTVKPEVTEAPLVLINSEGYPFSDTEIRYVINPLEYTPASIEVLFYEDNEYMGLMPGSRDKVVLSQGFAKFDPSKSYSFEIVLNRGSEMEIRSQRTVLSIGNFRILSFDDSQPVKGAVTDGVTKLRLQLIIEGDRQQAFANYRWRISDSKIATQALPASILGTLMNGDIPVDSMPVNLMHKE